jgi:hypothetical protein
MGFCLIMFMVIFKDKSWRFACLLIPFIPHISIYAGWIWKDTFFAFGYLLMSMWLAYKDIEQKRFNWLENIMFFIIAFYITSVKYQAKFILPILLFWYVSIQFSKLSITSSGHRIKSITKTTIITAALCFSIINGIEITNNFLVTKHGNGSNNAWQYKKIYDLVGASVHTNKILVPKFLAKKENFTLKDLKDHYDMTWEPLIVYEHSPLRSISSSKDLGDLHESWKQMITDQPIGYLKHRLYVWGNGIFLSTPVQSHFNRKPSISTLEDNLVGAHREHKTISAVLSFLMTKFYWLMYALVYGFICPFQVCFLYYSFKTYCKTNNKFAKPVFFMSLMGLSLVFLFFSLSAYARFIYFSNVMFFFTVPFFIAMRQTNQDLKCTE